MPNSTGRQPSPARRRTDNPQQQPRIDPVNLQPDPAILNQISPRARRIWSPYLGFGTLTGWTGQPPAAAHVAEFPEANRRIALHAAGFFVLN